MGNRPHIASIHVLDDDSLLNIFYLYRPFFLGEEDEGARDRIEGGRKQWIQGRWWYQLAHVCQRWRNIILGSASYLGLSLVCRNGTLVEVMLAHSPPLPLTVDYPSKVRISLQKMKRGCCLLSSSVIASATSALSSLFRICGSLLWQSMRNSRSWNT